LTSLKISLELGGLNTPNLLEKDIPPKLVRLFENRRKINAE
jgi:hypothetical protein